MIKLSAGFSRKIGEPNYSSRGASVNLELELESTAIQDPVQMHDRIRALFRLARVAVGEELRNGSAPAPSALHAPADPDIAPPPVCASCGAKGLSERVIAYSAEAYGKVLCYRCQRRHSPKGERS